MNIVILGGGGFIGTHLAEYLTANHSVTVYDRALPTKLGGREPFTGVRALVGDFLDLSQDLLHALREADVVVHLISTTLPSNSLNNPIFDIQTNVVGSVRLFEECINAGVGKIVFVSSGGTVYGIPKYCPIDEAHPLNPIVPYGISKLVVEKYLEMNRYQYGLDYAVLRLANPYGAGQRYQTGQGVISSWMHRVKLREAVEIWGDGNVVRDYVYILDVVKAINLAINVETDEKIFNVGTGKGYSLLQVHALLERVIGREIPVNFKELRSVDVPVNVLDVSLIKSVLGWESDTSLEDGMRLTWDYLSVQ